MNNEYFFCLLYGVAVKCQIKQQTHIHKVLSLLASVSLKVDVLITSCNHTFAFSSY